MTVSRRVDQALGREEAYAKALQLLAAAGTWAEVAQVQLALAELKAAAGTTIAELTS